MVEPEEGEKLFEKYNSINWVLGWLLIVKNEKSVELVKIAELLGLNRLRGGRSRTNHPLPTSWRLSLVERSRHYLRSQTVVPVFFRPDRSGTMGFQPGLALLSDRDFPCFSKNLFGFRRPGLF